MQLIMIKLVPPALVNNDNNDNNAIGTILTETSVAVTQKNLQEGKTG